MADVFTIDDLNALATLTTADEIPVWDAEASGEPTKKITASNLAASVKSLGNLIGTGDLDSTPTSGSNKAVTSGGVYTAIQQSTAKFEIKTFSIDVTSTTSSGNKYFGTRALTDAEMQGTKAIIPLYARKNAYNYICIVEFEGTTIRVQSDISLTGVVTGILFVY